MNVLSLFDGMSCGQIALERAGIKVDNYFASEVEPSCIKITQKNYPKTKQIGNVENWREWDLPQIDILLAGSPCQGFSFAGKGLAFDDPRSKLFFTFNDIRKKLKPKNFLLENVKMKKEYIDVISEHIGYEPMKINSSLVSAQNRVRLYWTDIPYLLDPKDKGIMLGDVIIEDFYANRPVRFYDKKAPTLRSGRIGLKILVHNIYGGFNENRCRVFDKKSPTLRTASGGGHIPSVFYGSKEEARALSLPELRKYCRKLEPEEAEELQTVPIGYTDGVSKTKRFNMLGNGWTVDVVAHILKGLINENL